MWEQSKAAKRRFHDGLFHSRYFVGRGIDIGGKPDPLGQYAGVFAGMGPVRTWDLEDGDAQLTGGVPDNEFDFLHSSHCLEHLHDPKSALQQWIRIVKPGGFLVVTVPDEDMYEHGQWPSIYNTDHKWTFTVYKLESWSPRSINVIALVTELSHLIDIERIVVLRDFFRDYLPGTVDQTSTPVAECGIEFILRKKEKPLQPRSQAITPQAVYDNLSRVRGAPVASAAEDIAHSVVIPLATYSPWRNDAAFAEAFAAASKHTLLDVYRTWELWHLVKQVSATAGEILEVGVWRGGSAAILGLAVKALGIDAKLYLADTFSGAGKVGHQVPVHRGGEHYDASRETVEGFLHALEVHNFELRIGVFPEVAGMGLENCRFRLCHIDVDVYQSAKAIFDWIWPRLAASGVVVFDNYGFAGCEGVTRLVNELPPKSDALTVHNLNGHAIVVKILSPR